MPDIRHALQNLADAISPETGTQDGYIDSMDTSINRIAEALPDKLDEFLVAPSVTAEDNGKVLMVVDGAWDKTYVAGDGGTEFMVVTITHTSPSIGVSESTTADKTLAEIVEAYTAGTPILMHNIEVFNGEESDQGYWLCDNISAMIPDSVLSASRLQFNLTLQALSVTTYTINADGTITVTSHNYNLTSGT